MRRDGRRVTILISAEGLRARAGHFHLLREHAKPGTIKLYFDASRIFA